MTVYVHSADVVMCEIGDSTALLDLNTSKYFKLNPSASIVWASTSGLGGTFEGIRNEMLNRFDVSLEQCEADVRSLLIALCDAGLLQANEI